MRAAATVAVVVLELVSRLGPAHAKPAAKAGAPRVEAAPEAIAIEAPASVALGSAPSVTLALRAPAGVRLVASVGQLSAPQAGPSGRRSFRYTLPEGHHPQLALLAAADDEGRLYAFRALQLEGGARLEVQSEPRVSVRVRVGAVDLGPFTTDDAGRAILPIRAPPGVDEALLLADDGHGGVTKKRLPLGVPESPRVLVSCARSSTEVWLAATERNGAPLGSAIPEGAAHGRDAPGLVLEAVRETGGAGGSFAPLEQLRPGLYRTRLLPSGELTDGERVTVRARLRDGGPAASCQLEGEPPSGAGLALDRPAWTAGSGPVRVTVIPRFPGRRWHRAVRVELEPELGRIALAHDGALVAEWRLPDALAGRTEATLTARLGPPEAKLTARTTLALHAGPADRLRVDSSAARLPADGRSEATLRIAATDRFGNPVPGARFVARGDGVFGARPALPDGTAQARFRPPRRLERRATVGHELPDETELVVRDERGGNLATVRLRLSPVPRRFEATVRLGYLTNFAKISAALVEADLLYRLPVWSEQLWVGLSAGFAASDTRQASADGAEQVGVRVRAAPVLARFAVQPRLVPKVSLYAGVTGGLSVASTQVSSPRAGALERTDVTWAVGGFAGAGVRLGPGRLSAELAWLHAPIAGEAASGNTAGLALTLGYGVDFE